MSVHKDQKRGTYSFRLWVVDGDGRRRQMHRGGFALKRQAEAAERQARLEAEGTPRVGRNTRLRVSDYLTDGWLPAIAGRGLKATTLDTYRRSARLYLVPHLGRVELAKLSTADVEQMLGRLMTDGLTPKYCRNIIGVLSSALTDARRWRLMTANVTADVLLPRATQTPPRAWTTKELARFLERAREEDLEPVWRFVALTGCRRGEAVGIRWRDVDLDQATATFVNTRPIAGGKVVEGTPKSAAGGRTIALDAELVTMLRSWHLTQRQRHLALGLGSDPAYVFTGPDGRALWPQRVTARFRGLCDELGLARIGLQGLRHTSVTFGIASGQNPKLVAQRHGHSSSSFTIGRYSHVLPGHDRAAAEALAQALRDAAQESTDDLVTTVVTTGTDSGT